MPAKIKGIKKVIRNLNQVLPDARSSFAIEAKKTIVDLIVEKISQGISPVKGQNRFPKYSESYAKVKGRRQPVDLIKSGKMLDNLIAKIKSNKNIELFFRDKKSSELATYHTKGMGNLPKRKILPQGREVFKSDIMSNIAKILKKSLRLSIRKNGFK